LYYIVPLSWGEASSPIIQTGIPTVKDASPIHSTKKDEKRRELALFAALRRENASLMSLYLALSLFGAAAFVVSRPGFEMLSLSHAYAAATTDAQRAVYLAAGEATLAVFEGMAYWVSYILGSISGLVISVVILRGGVFSKSTGYLRFASSVLDFGIFVPAVGLFIALLSVFCLMGFNILVSRRLLQIGSAGHVDWAGGDS